MKIEAPGGPAAVPATSGAWPRINGARLWSRLETLARIGATPKGGVRRLTLTDLDRQARDLVRGWLEAAGCRIRVDAIGNVFAIRPGRTDGPAVAAGSHVDTQPNGGRFDGNYGVLAGLEVLETLNDAGIRTERPLAVAIWTNEEGTRYTPVMMGSGVHAGAFTLEHALAQTDRDGISVKDALDAIGYAGRDEAPRFAAYVEPHIEQGPVLEDSGIPIGAVTGALGQRWFDLTLTGQDAHAGPTPLALRRDALLAASRLVIAVREIAAAHAPDARGTVGMLEVSPGSRNVIPGQVKMTVDLRAGTDATLDAMVAALHERIRAVRDADGVEIAAREVVYFPPCVFDETLVSAVERHAKDLGHAVRRLPSGAGHDAVYVARTCPAAMIFVPCEGGISHNEAENARPEHLAAGADVLLRVMLEAASRVD